MAFVRLLKRTLPWVLYIGASSIVLIALFIAGLYFSLYLQGPPSLTSEQNTVIFAGKEQVIGVKHGNESRYWVELDDISPYLKKAFIVTEDQHFYEHNGFDFKRIVAAVGKNILAMDKIQGASTITQQYARNLYLNHEKTWERKLKEAIHTIRLEMFYDKDRIFEGYLNTIYFGHGNYGIEAASRYYFDKHADELTLEEAALLVAIPKGPSYYSPILYPEHAIQRQRMILKQMHEHGVITAKEYQQALAKKIIIEPEKRDVEEVAPYFQDAVVREAMNILSVTKEELYTGGYHIYTTLDVDRQNELEKTIEQTIDQESSIQIAGVSMDPETGAIQALVGGRNYDKSPYNRAIQAKRMAGSTFKPFLYYAALKNGYTPVTSLMSKPTYFQLENGQTYQPSNYNGYYAYAPITMTQALALSDNIYAVKTNLFLKPETLVETARTFGIRSDLPAVPSLALGTASVSVLEMTEAYSKLANNGKQVIPHTVTKITNHRGKVIYSREDSKPEQVLDPQVTYVLTHMMTGIFDESLNGYSSVTGASINHMLTRTYAGKSGTTNSDSWMIGFTPQLVTAIWTGYDKNQEMTKVEEKGYAKEIWAAYMEKAHEDLPIDVFRPPEGVTGVYIDPQTGKIATKHCPNRRLTFFIEGTEPRSRCDEHVPEEGLKEEDRIPDGQKSREKQEKKGGWRSIFDWLF